MSIRWRKFAQPRTDGTGSLNVGKALDCLGEPCNSVFCIAMFDSVADAVTYMAFQNNLANPVQGRLGSVNLGENVLAGNILVNHAVYGLNLSYDFAETAVQVCLVHALLHENMRASCGFDPHEPRILPKRPAVQGAGLCLQQFPLFNKIEPLLIIMSTPYPKGGPQWLCFFLAVYKDDVKRAETNNKIEQYIQ